MRPGARPCAALVAVTLLAAVAAGPALAQDAAVKWRRLDADAARRELLDHTVEGFYPSGEAFVERFGADLSSDYSDALRRTPGVISFSGDSMCFEYPPASNVSGGCFVIWQRSENCYDFYAVRGDGRSTSLLERSLGYTWDARVWRIDAKSTCPSIPLS